MYVKQRNSRYKKRSNQLFFEHDDRVNNIKPNLKNQSMAYNNKKYKKINQKNRKINKDKVVNNCGKHNNIIMCYCHCSISQLHANTTFCCATNTQEKNCGGFGLPVNWKIFQSRCQCRICEINFFKDIKGSSSCLLETEKPYEKENQTIKSTLGVSEMFTPSSPPVDSYRKKSMDGKKKNIYIDPHTDQLNETKVLKNEDFKEILKGISEKKVQDAIISKKKKKKKRHKKSKYKSSKSDKSENESSKRRKFRKNKKNKKDSGIVNESYSSRRSSPSKKNIENIKMDRREDTTNEHYIPHKKKKNNYEKVRNSPTDTYDDGKLTPVFLNNIKADEKSNIRLNTQLIKISRSPSPEVSPSSYDVNRNNSNSKSNVSSAHSLNEVKNFSGKQQEQPFQNKTVNSNEILESLNKLHKKNKYSSNISSSENLNNRVSKSFDDGHSIDKADNNNRAQYNKTKATTTSSELPFEKFDKKYTSTGNSSFNNDINCNKNQRHLQSTKLTATSTLEIPTKSSKNTAGNERRYDNYNENTISGKDLDSYVNAIMIDEYKEKKLNDFELLEELKNNIAIKAKEKIKSIEKVSNENFFTVPSVNKFISGILSSPESSTTATGNYSNIPTFHMKETPGGESTDPFKTKWQIAEENVQKTSEELPGDKLLTTDQLRDFNEENNEKSLNKKVKRSSRSRSKSRYSSESSETSSRSKYSYSSSHYSHSYSRSSSRSSESLSRSRSRSRSHSRSPSIPRRRGSPSFLERRRITSARKRPVPYNRIPRSSIDQSRQAVCNIYTTIMRKHQPSI